MVSRMVQSVQLNQTFVDSFSVWPKPYERHAFWLTCLPRGFLSRKEISPRLKRDAIVRYFLFFLHAV